MAEGYLLDAASIETLRELNRRVSGESITRRTERPRLVRAALTLLRAWVVAGRPDMGLPLWGSFEEWSRVVPAALVFADRPEIPASSASACRRDPVALW